mmetsp:Transcript_28759/g.72893  ORF Transcript_28759/g.72893 Transcript_28759/m.72893 type:complete len:697 (-) Transcript_28759:4-2094(-)
MWKGADRVANWVKALRTPRKDGSGTMFGSKYLPAQKGAVKPGFLYEFPWEPLGGAKYVLFLPFLYIVAAGLDDSDNWAFHMLCIVALRYVQAQFWHFVSRNHAISGKTRVQARLVGFEQVDREENWDDYIILQLYIATAVHMLPWLYCYQGTCYGYRDFPLFHGKGLLQLILIHAGPTELIYYWLHRALHGHTLYAKYHSHHHASFVTEPISGSAHPFMEHLLYTANFAIPLLGTWAVGGASIAMFYTYMLGFDLLNIIGHCNFEFFPVWLFKALPFMKYMIYTPSFHSLHHSRVHTNFCLFMPIYDYLGGTLDPKSWDLYFNAAEGKAVPERAPDAIFLGHGTEILSVFHLPFLSRSFSAKPYKAQPWMYVLWPVAVQLLLAMRVFVGKVFVADKHRLGKLELQTWVTPACAIEFFFKGQWKRINSYIEDAIVKADKQGVKVFGLGALNKNEALNGGGALFVQNNPHLKMRVVHGNTLTAAAVLRKIPADTKSVFILGATSKLGRAISLYLAVRGIKCTLLTMSKERFDKVVVDCPKQFQGNLVRTEKISDGASFDTWVVGRFLSNKEQEVAPGGTTFHQFVVPMLPEVRKDCFYSNMPAFKLPAEAQGFKSCEMTMGRSEVHACHAGALVHALEGWEHHEVGPIDPERIDLTWNASRKHGFELVADEDWVQINGGGVSPTASSAGSGSLAEHNN